MNQIQPNNITVYIPTKIQPLFSTKKRFIVIFGGRGSGKSWGVALFLILKAMNFKIRVLCTREIQNSIKDSVHKLLSDTISKYHFDKYFIITEKSIKSINGSEFIFKGLRHNPNDIKSTEGIDYCWVEEAHSVSRKSLEILTPTIRKECSQIIFTYNPTDEFDPVHADYTLGDRDDILKINVNHNDNKKFPAVLKAEMEYDKRVDYDKYLHIWEGKCQKHSDAQVFFKKWQVDNFNTEELKPEFIYFGADWGFSQDATCLIRCFIKDNILYIDYEVYGVGVDIDKTPQMFDNVPDCRKYDIIADSARPETISYMKRNGFRIRGAYKGAGSVEDGIAYLRSFEKIIIHERCKHAIDEFRLYSYKVDPHTGIISNKLEDKNNHCIDALRYALEDRMRHRQGKVIQKTGW